jgi:hypothetical protein
MPSDEQLFDACPAPWTQFPFIAPEMLARYLTQGETEWWFDEVWRPFWDPLTSAQKDRYLNHWSATPAWREALEVFEQPSDFDVDADARESEIYLAERERERATQEQPSLLKRLFGRKP